MALSKTESAVTRSSKTPPEWQAQRQAWVRVVLQLLLAMKLKISIKLIASSIWLTTSKNHSWTKCHLRKGSCIPRAWSMSRATWRLLRWPRRMSLAHFRRNITEAQIPRVQLSWIWIWILSHWYLTVINLDLFQIRALTSSCKESIEGFKFSKIWN